MQPERAKKLRPLRLNLFEIKPQGHGHQAREQYHQTAEPAIFKNVTERFLCDGQGAYFHYRVTFA